MEQTVNLTADTLVGSNPTLTTISFNDINRLRCWRNLVDAPASNPGFLFRVRISGTVPDGLQRGDGLPGGIKLS